MVSDVQKARRAVYDAAPMAIDGRVYRDLTGVRVGKLTARQRVLRPGTPRYWWLLECDCGKMCYSTAQNLRGGHKTSCGCAARGGAIASNYSPYRDEIIRRFTSPDRPAGQSVAQLAREIGITKNTAIGVLYRAGLIGFEPKQQPILAFPEPGSCLFMFGEFGSTGFHWCGEPCDGGSYCPEHRVTVYMQDKPDKDLPKAA